MSKLTNLDLYAIKDTIKHDGEVRFHIIRSRSNLTTKCRLWHTDGHVLGSASGGGYDKAGTALGQAIEALFAEELKALKPGSEWQEMAGNTGLYVTHKDGFYGLRRGRDREMGLDGACGLECMLTILRALGFSNTTRYDTGKLSDMVIARK